jgi:phage repressor protein C with HTH and peptisase S24 domain
MNINERIIAKTKELRMTQVELAAKIGLTKGAVNQWFKGLSAPNGENLLNTAKALGVTPDWLQFGIESRKEASNVVLTNTPVAAWNEESDLDEHGKYVFIPRYDVRVSAGDGMIVWDEQQKDQAQAYRLSFIRITGLKEDALRVIYAHGDSMEPRIYDGDSLLIDISQTNIIDGKTYVVRIESEVYVKVLRKLPFGELAVISHNADAYPVKTYSAEQCASIEVIGRVVQVSSMGGL